MASNLTREQRTYVREFVKQHKTETLKMKNLIPELHDDYEGVSKELKECLITILSYQRDLQQMRYAVELSRDCFTSGLTELLFATPLTDFFKKPATNKSDLGTSPAVGSLGTLVDEFYRRNRLALDGFERTAIALGHLQEAREQLMMFQLSRDALGLSSAWAEAKKLVVRCLRETRSTLGMPEMDDRYANGTLDLDSVLQPLAPDMQGEMELAPGASGEPGHTGLPELSALVGEISGHVSLAAEITNQKPEHTSSSLRLVRELLRAEIDKASKSKTTEKEPPGFRTQANSPARYGLTPEDERFFSELSGASRGDLISLPPGLPELVDSTAALTEADVARLQERQTELMTLCLKKSAQLNDMILAMGIKMDTELGKQKGGGGDYLVGAKPLEASVINALILAVITIVMSPESMGSVLIILRGLMIARLTYSALVAICVTAKKGYRMVWPLTKPVASVGRSVTNWVKDNNNAVRKYQDKLTKAENELRFYERAALRAEQINAVAEERALLAVQVYQQQQQQQQQNPAAAIVIYQGGAPQPAAAPGGGLNPILQPVIANALDAGNALQRAEHDAQNRAAALQELQDNPTALTHIAKIAGGAVAYMVVTANIATVGAAMCVGITTLSVMSELQHISAMARHDILGASAELTEKLLSTPILGYAMLHEPSATSISANWRNGPSMVHNGVRYTRGDLSLDFWRGAINNPEYDLHHASRKTIDQLCRIWGGEDHPSEYFSEWGVRAALMATDAWAAPVIFMAHLVVFAQHTAVTSIFGPGVATFIDFYFSSNINTVVALFGLITTPVFVRMLEDMIINVLDVRIPVSQVEIPLEPLTPGTHERSIRWIRSVIEGIAEFTKFPTSFDAALGSDKNDPLSKKIGGKLGYRGVKIMQDGWNTIRSGKATRGDWAKLPVGLGALVTGVLLKSCVMRSRYVLFSFLMGVPSYIASGVMTGGDWAFLRYNALKPITAFGTQDKVFLAAITGNILQKCLAWPKLGSVGELINVVLRIPLVMDIGDRVGGPLWNKLLNKPGPDPTPSLVDSKPVVEFKVVHSPKVPAIVPGDKTVHSLWASLYDLPRDPQWCVTRLSYKTNAAALATVDLFLSLQRHRIKPKLLESLLTKLRNMSAVAFANWWTSTSRTHEDDEGPKTNMDITDQVIIQKEFTRLLILTARQAPFYDTTDLVTQLVTMPQLGRGGSDGEHVLAWAPAVSQTATATLWGQYTLPTNSILMFKVYFE